MQFSYAAMAAFFLLIWIALFILLPRSRYAVLWTSIMFAHAGLVAEYWNLQDYWHPVYLLDVTIGKWRFGLEDYVLTFALAGISAGIFESLALRCGFEELQPISRGTLLRMTGLGILGFLLMVILASFLHLKSIHALLYAVTVPSLIMLATRQKIFKLVLPVAVVYGFLYWLFYVLLSNLIFPGMIQAFWNLDTTWGIMLAGIPIEEPLWAFTTALFCGPVFRICSAKAVARVAVPARS